MVPPLFITETLRLRLSAHPEKKKQKSASIPASRLLFHKPNLNFTLSFSRKCNYNVNLNITYYLDEISNTLFSIITLCK